MIPEIIALLMSIAFLYLLFKFTKSLVSLLINSVVSVVILFVLNYLGLGLAINIWSVLVVAIGGLLGLLLVLVLHAFGIAF